MVQPRKRSGFVNSLKKSTPMKLGLALSSAGHSLCGIAGVSSISGGHGWLVEYSVIVGFFMGVIGNFFTVLFTNGHGEKKKITEIKSCNEIRST